MSQGFRSIKRSRGVPFAFKLAVSYVLVVLVAALGLGWLGNQYLQEVPARRLAGHAETVANMLAAMASAAPDLLWSPLFENQVREVSEESGLQLLVFRGDGRLLASPGPASEYVRWWDESPVMQQARLYGEARWKEGGSEESTRRIIVQPIRIAWENIGYVVAEVSMESLAQERWALAWKFLGVSAGGVGLALLLGLVLAGKVTNPLRQIVRRCEAIAEGDWASPMKLSEGGDFGLVNQTIEEMAAKLVQQRADAEKRREHLEKLLALLQDAVLVVAGPGLRLVFCNARAADYFFPDRYVQRGTSLAEAISCPALLEQLETIVHEGMARRMDVQWESQNGEDRFGVLYATPLDEDEEELQFLLVVHEVTDAVRFETLRRDFASNVSHELKTPIAAIGAILDVLIEEQGIEDFQVRRNFLARLRNQNERMLRLVQELLTLSKLESGSNVLEFKRVEACTVMNAAEETFRRFAETRRIRLSFHLAPDLRPVWGDPVALEVMLNSLIDNALRYTHEGGEVRVSVEPADERTARFTVSDNGPGIPRGDRARIFERFYRVESSRSRERGGSGLGLAIVKHLVEAHGGAIELDSEPGHGSAFSLLLSFAHASWSMFAEGDRRQLSN